MYTLKPTKCKSKNVVHYSPRKQMCRNHSLKHPIKLISRISQHYHVNTLHLYTLYQWSPTLLLESNNPAGIYPNPNPVCPILLWSSSSRSLMAKRGENHWNGSPPGTGLGITALCQSKVHAANSTELKTNCIYKGSVYEKQQRTALQED